MTALIKFFSFILIFLTFTSCSKGFFKKMDTRETPVNAQERARKNVEEGRGVSIAGIIKGRKSSTNYEFSTANPMWRASLEILDFLPMTTVDYSGGMIISDWYSDNTSSNSESIKITLRFLSNEVRSESLKIIVHKKICKTSSTCTVKILNNSAISQELRSTIIKQAALLESEAKDKKKK